MPRDADYTFDLRILERCPALWARREFAAA
jgi:hypothetical protein